MVCSFQCIYSSLVCFCIINFTTHSVKCVYVFVSVSYSFWKFSSYNRRERARALLPMKKSLVKNESLLEMESCMRNVCFDRLLLSSMNNIIYFKCLIHQALHGLFNFSSNVFQASIVHFKRQNAFVSHWEHLYNHI